MVVDWRAARAMVEFGFVVVFVVGVEVPRTLEVYVKSPELYARIAKAAKDNPDMTRVALGKRFGCDPVTVTNALAYHGVELARDNHRGWGKDTLGRLLNSKVTRYTR